jgi:NitT/TauT family transport system substrate-binding protein
VLSDPARTMFSRRHPDAPVFADVRTAGGVRQIYGTDTYVSAVLISRAPWLRSNPDVARRLARAVNQSLRWIHTHSVEEITKETPEQLRGSDPALFEQSLRASLPSFPESSRFERTGVEAVMKVLKVADKEKTLENVELKKTYTNEFAPEE